MTTKNTNDVTEVASFGLEQLEERWKPYGYTVETAMLAKAAYEEWSKEGLHFESLDDAILGTNVSGGDFPVRLEAFFAGWISSANADVDLPPRTSPQNKQDASGG